MKIHTLLLCMDNLCKSNTCIGDKIAFGRCKYKFYLLNTTCINYLRNLACLLLCKEEGSSPVSLQLLRGGIWACMRCPCLCLCWVLG